MDRENIIKKIEEANFGEIQIVENASENDILAVRLFYDFDSEEIESAKAYANDECKEEVESDSWYEEFFFEYLMDLAVDNLGELVEEIVETYDVDVEYMSYELEKEIHDYCEFIIIIYEKDKQIDFDDIIDKIEEN